MKRHWPPTHPNDGVVALLAVRGHVLLIVPLTIQVASLLHKANVDQLDTALGVGAHEVVRAPAVAQGRHKGTPAHTRRKQSCHVYTPLGHHDETGDNNKNMLKGHKAAEAQLMYIAPDLDQHFTQHDPAKLLLIHTTVAPDGVLLATDPDQRFT